MSAKDLLVDLVEYVEQVHRLSERVVTRLQDYRDLVLHETDLKAREGMHHDLVEGGEAAWLKIERLRRTDPPDAPEQIGDWIAVSRDPSKPVQTNDTRTLTVTLEEAERLVSQGLALADEVMKPLKPPSDGVERRDVILRLQQQPGVADAINSYVEGAWRTWAERERPRRQTIEIYEKLFALEQTFEAAGGESAKELVWGIGLARWHQPPVAIDHCLIEQLVEIEIDPHDASLRIRPRSTEPFVYLKPFFDLDLPAQSEAALTVLRDHLPLGVRDLAVALLTSEREGLRQLERAAGILATEASQMDSRRVKADILAGQERVLRLKEELIGIDRELEVWARKHLSGTGKNPVDGVALRPIDLARKVNEERHEHAWFVDRPSPGEDGQPQFTDADVRRLMEARREVGPDLSYIGVELPPLADLSGAAEIAVTHTELVEARRLSKEADRQGVPPLSTTAEDALERAEKLAAVLRQVLDYHELVVKNPWLAALSLRWMQNSKRDASPTPLDDVIAEIEVIAEEWNQLIREAVRVPDDVLGCQTAEDAIGRLASGQKPFPLVSFGKAIASAKDLLAGITVSGERLSNREQARTVVRYLSWRRRVIRCVARWNALWLEHGLPELDDRGDRAGRELIGMLEAVRAGKRLATVNAPVLRRETAALFPNAKWGEAALFDPTEAKVALHDVEMTIARQHLTGRAALVRRLKERFVSGSSPIHIDFRKFLDADLGNPGRPVEDISNRWQELSAELERLRNLQPQLQALAEITAKIEASGAPNWAWRLREEPAGSGNDCLLPANWHSSWRWAQLDRYLTEIDGRKTIKRLSRRRLEIESELQRVFGEVVRLRTFAGLKRSMTPAVESALMMFVQAVRRIGAGTGVRAVRHRRTARQAMQTCAKSVPCWIMPGWRVSESLPPSLGTFDLVICGRSFPGRCPTPAGASERAKIARGRRR